jgi:PAS domain S-box-containing protein
MESDKMAGSRIENENPPSEEWLGAEILRSAGDAIVFADRGGIIRYWNGAAEVMFGYTADEANGRSLDLIIPERLRQRHNEGYERAMATGKTKYATDLLKVPAVRKDGSSISLEFSVVLIGRPVLGVAAILRDVTADWQERKDLARRIADAEARVKEVEATST